MKQIIAILLLCIFIVGCVARKQYIFDPNTKEQILKCKISDVKLERDTPKWQKERLIPIVFLGYISHENNDGNVLIHTVGEELKEIVNINDQIVSINNINIKSRNQYVKRVSEN